MVFEGTARVYERQFQMSKREREIYEFEMDLNKLFVCAPMT